MQKVEWFLEVQGKKYGPYTLEQVHGYLRRGQIQVDNKITAEHLQGKWISLKDFLKEHPMAHQNHSAKPSPSNPVDELFEVVQSASEKRAAQKMVKKLDKKTEDRVNESSDERSKNLSSFGLKIFGIVLVTFVLFWIAKVMLPKHDSPEPVATLNPSSQGTSPPAQFVPKESPQQSVNPTTPPRQESPPQIADPERERQAEQERERELDRERERERMREREEANQETNSENPSGDVPSPNPQYAPVPPGKF